MKSRYKITYRRGSDGIWRAYNKEGLVLKCQSVKSLVMNIKILEEVSLRCSVRISREDADKFKSLCGNMSSDIHFFYIQ